MGTWVNIVYIGKIYVGKQDPTKLFQALKELIEGGEVKREAIAVDFYGDIHRWLDKDIERYGLVGIVKQHGRVSHGESLRVQRDARILWLMKWEGMGKGDGRLGRILSWVFLGKKGVEYSKEFDRKYAGKPAEGGIPMKLWEYIAARGPILATGGHRDEVSRILGEANAGMCCETVEEIKDFIRDIY